MANLIFKVNERIYWRNRFALLLCKGIIMKNINNNFLYYVYKHTNIYNDKVYIGITIREPRKRWGSKGCNYKGNPIFYKDIFEYGWDEGFTHEVLFENLTKEEAEKKEIELIELYNSTDINRGYNRNHGGHSIGKMSDETKNKISKSNTGKRRTLEQRKLMSDIAFNMTDEHKRKISEAHKGLDVWNKGLTFTENEKDKIKGNTYKPIICIETGVVYKSMSYVSRLFKIPPSNLHKVCNGERHTAGGFHWRYANE